MVRGISLHCSSEKTRGARAVVQADEADVRLEEAKLPRERIYASFALFRFDCIPC